jgi:hypothetical protein
MSNQGTLWVFGPSMCLPFNLKNEDNGWGAILSKSLNLHYKNFAESACDNFFIYHCYRENLNQITKNDLVVIGWSHPSRKTFVLDRENSAQMNVLNQSTYYRTSSLEFIRSKNPVNDSWLKYLTQMRPKNRGTQYYDDWFSKYYSEYEQSCNFQSYVDSVEYTCPAKYAPFFFSNESVKDIKIASAGSMIQFIQEHDVAISEKDCHLNEKGHLMWANHLLNYLKTKYN